MISLRMALRLGYIPLLLEAFPDFIDAMSARVGDGTTRSCRGLEARGFPFAALAYSMARVLML